MAQQEILFEDLLTRIRAYHPAKDLSLVERAYTIARQAHGEQLRKSGEPYIVHPLCVAYILADLELDLESIVSGLLHDVIEDTVFGYPAICEMFGQEIADIVDGVTKLDKIETSLTGTQPEKAEAEKPKDKNYREELQAENYRKMFLAMAKDIRVILIKIADRLHNLRTLKFMSEEKQKEKAQETLDIYAPLAHRLGISKLRYELEDLSFRFLNPDAYYDLADKISLKQCERQAYIQNVVDTLEANFAEQGVTATVEGRPKHFFSIYKKMISKEKTLDQIFDLFAVRVIVASIRDCYEILGHVHELYKPVPGHFKDYIAVPKSNMYQSLHTVIIGPLGEPVEIQIRTWDMHRAAEYGIAAHWRYKEGAGGVVQPGSEEAKLAWLRQILDWQRDLTDNQEFLNALKVDLDVFTDHVYCFTPRGEIINLLRGSTPIDFAYAIHTAIGNKMIGARINGNIVGFDYNLQSGDRVEVITSQNSKGPSRDWLNLVRTSQARSKINQWFKKENREENILRGVDLLEKEARRKGWTLPSLLNDKREVLLLSKFSFLDWNSLCAAVGHGGLKEGQVINRLIADYEKERQREIELPLVRPDTGASRRNTGDVLVKNLGEALVRYSKCCSPVPGDEIVGYTTRGRGLSIHRTDCANILHLDELERLRLIEVEWRDLEHMAVHHTYRADIKVVCDARIGMLADISRVLSEEHIQIRAINSQASRHEIIFCIGLDIKSREQLEKIQDKILNQRGVHEIQRVSCL
jgi:GTP pyrophosphokinase